MKTKPNAIRCFLHRLRSVGVTFAFSPVPVLFSALALSLALLPRTALAQPPDYLNAQKPLEIRLDALMGRLTLDEKIAMLTGIHDMLTHPIPRLRIPSFEMVDGATFGYFSPNARPTTAISLFSFEVRAPLNRN